MLYYITGNEGKIRVAKKYLEPLGVFFEPKELELVEIQSHSIDEITRNKAEQAFARVQQPLFVNDAGWNFPALNGFPGPYMHYINEWLTPVDFMNLMNDHEDKTVIFTEYFCYIDGKKTKLFKQEIKGTFLDKPEGNESAARSLISLREDKVSIAASWIKGIEPVDHYTVWKEFAEWYKQNK